MREDIKIAMLGTQGAGKTCYMVGMYAMMEFGYHGFTFSTQHPDDGLRLNRLWDKLVDSQTESRWPPPTSAGETKDYKFNFNYGFKPLMRFEWMDYRGGALSDASDQADVAKLLEQIKECSCLFLCVSGEALQSGNIRTAADQIKVNRMNALLTQIADRFKVSDQRPFPVAIVITKFDLCKNRDKEEIIEDVQTLFQGLFVPQSGWLVSICPVSLLGRNSSGNPNQAEIDPVNVHLPVAFAVYSKFREQGLDHRATMATTQESIDLMGSNWLKRWWNSGDIGTARGKVQELEAQLQQIQIGMALLSKELRNTPLYLSGREVSIDV